MESNVELGDELAENSTIGGENSGADDMVVTAENSGERSNSSEQSGDGLADGSANSSLKASNEVDIIVDRSQSGMSERRDVASQTGDDVIVDRSQSGMSERRDVASQTGEEGMDADRELQEMFEGKEETRVEDETALQNRDPYTSDVDENSGADDMVVTAENSGERSNSPEKIGDGLADGSASSASKASNEVHVIVDRSQSGMSERRDVACQTGEEGMDADEVDVIVDRSQSGMSERRDAACQTGEEGMDADRKLQKMSEGKEETRVEDETALQNSDPYTSDVDENSGADDMVVTAKNSGERSNSPEQIRDGLADGSASSASKASNEVDVIVDRSQSGMSERRDVACQTGEEGMDADEVDVIVDRSQSGMSERRDAACQTGEEGMDADRELQKMSEGKEETRVEDETALQNSDPYTSDVDENSGADDMVVTAENSGEMSNSPEQIRDGLADGSASSASKASTEVEVNIVDRSQSGMSKRRDVACQTGEEGMDADRELQEMFEGKEETRVEDETAPQNSDTFEVDDQFERDETDEGNVVETALLSEDVDMIEKFELLKELISSEQRELRDKLLRNYEDVHTLKRAFEHSKNVLGVCKDYVKTLYCNVDDLSKVMEDVKVTLDKKMKTERLTTWLDKENIDKKDLEAVAEHTKLLAKAAEAKTEFAESEVALVEAIQMAAECKKEAAELEEEARAAQVKAVEHRRAVEEAQKKAEEKRKKLEEQRRQEAEKAKKKEEEDERRREKEQKRLEELERIKGTPEEVEMLRMEEEQRQAEEERKDPQNWPKCIYTEKKTDDGDYGADPEIICIVRAMNGVLNSDDLVCESLNQLDGILPLEENEELVSQIVQLKPALPDTLFPQCAEPWAVAIPYVAPRNNPIREAIIKVLNGNSWTEMMTFDTTFSDITDKHFCECQVSGPVTLAVLLNIKKDMVVMGKKGGKYLSPLDSRVSLTVPPRFFRVTSTFSLKIQPVELGMVTEVKLRYPQVCENLFASSPIIHLGLKNKKFVKPMMATVPCPLNPARQKRPGTAGLGGDDKSDNKPHGRPKSALVIGFHSFKVEDEPEDRLILLTREHAEPWVMKGLITHTQSKNKDIAVVELSEPVERFMVLRLKADTSTTLAEDIATTTEKHINRRVVACLLRQRSDNPSDVIITCTNISRIEREQRKLNEAGYEDGPSRSKDIIIQEGQKLWIKFRGNIRCMDKHFSALEFAFNSHLNSSLRFSVADVDQYAQKSSNVYRGFAQIYTTHDGMLQRAVKIEDKGSTKKKDAMKMELVQGEQLLSELLINLPKPDPEPPQPILKAPVQFKSDSIIDDALFRQLAGDLRNEWKLLAAALNVKRARIQAILRDHVSDSDSEASIYDMLVTWVKKIPHSINKVEILCTGLITVGRTDLVEVIKDRERDWKFERANKAKEAKLNRAFLKVAQNVEVINDWRHLALVLGLDVDEIDGIEEGVIGSREQCHRALLLWKQNDPLASVNTLSRLLKKIKCRSAAEEIQQLA